LIFRVKRRAKGYATEVARKYERTCVGLVDESPVVRNPKTLRPGESQGRKGRRQAMSFLGFRMETLEHARTARVVGWAR
jgi:hypothetical protein